MEIAERLNGILQQYQATLSAPDATRTVRNVLDDVRSVTRPEVDFGAPYVLTLSQAAQEVLAQKSGNSFVAPISLSEGQLVKLESILSQYESAPLNAETTQALYSDLKAAGLLPSQLATAEEAQRYDAGLALLELVGGEAKPKGLLNGVSGLLGGTSSESIGSSEQLAVTLLRYGEISGESQNINIDAKVSGYLDLLEQGGLVT